MKTTSTLRIDPSLRASAELNTVSVWSNGQVINLSGHQALELASALLQAALHGRYQIVEDVTVNR